MRGNKNNFVWLLDAWLPHGYKVVPIPYIMSPPNLNQVVRNPSLVSSLQPWMLGDFWHDTPFNLPISPSQGLSAWGFVRWYYSDLHGLHHNNWWWQGCLTSLLFLYFYLWYWLVSLFFPRFSSLDSIFPFLMYFSFSLALYLWLAFRSDIDTPTLRCLVTIFSIHNNLFFGLSQTLLYFVWALGEHKRMISYEII